MRTTNKLKSTVAWIIRYLTLAVDVLLRPAACDSKPRCSQEANSVQRVSCWWDPIFSGPRLETQFWRFVFPFWKVSSWTGYAIPWFTLWDPTSAWQVDGIRRRRFLPTLPGWPPLRIVSEFRPLSNVKYSLVHSVESFKVLCFHDHDCNGGPRENYFWIGWCWLAL